MSKVVYFDKNECLCVTDINRVFGTNISGTFISETLGVKPHATTRVGTWFKKDDIPTIGYAMAAYFSKIASEWK